MGATTTMTTRVTKELARWIAEAPQLAEEARTITSARHALLDWMGVTLAGTSEPAPRIVMADLLADSLGGDCALIGQSHRTNAPFAALINGVASHVLDFDDINKMMRGHPSVTVIPAVLAMAETLNSDGHSMLEAIVIGTEVACRIGDMLGASHYEVGWHTTGTAGTIGAAAGVGRLLGLTSAQAEMAIGIAATQAAGMKIMFGSMCKPLHAGKAAMNGLLAARWAASGFDSVENALEAPQGFGSLMSPGFKPLELDALPGKSHAIESNIYKFHASCYYTHSAIEALRSLVRERSINPSDISLLRVRIPKQHLTVIDIKSPKSGLELKFSITQLLAMVLVGIDTSIPENFSVETAQRQDIVTISNRILVIGNDFESRTASEVWLRLGNGSEHSLELDVGIPQQDFTHQEELLAEKFLALTRPVLGFDAASRLQHAIMRLGHGSSVRALAEFARTDKTRS